MDADDTYREQGVIIVRIDSHDDNSLDEIYQLMEVEPSQLVPGGGVKLRLENKYYRTGVFMFDDRLQHGIIPNDKCHAMILYSDIESVSVDTLDATTNKFSDVRGDVRLLLLKSLGVDREAHQPIFHWCIENGFDMIGTEEEDVKTKIIDSLSAYRWPHRIDEPRKWPAARGPETSGTQANDKPQPTGEQQLASGDEDKASDRTPERNEENGESQSEISGQKDLEPEVYKMIQDFDSLLSKISAFRDQSRAKTDLDDRRIEEIADLLGGLLGEEVYTLLEDEDEVDSAKDESNPRPPEGAAVHDEAQPT